MIERERDKRLLKNGDERLWQIIGQRPQARAEPRAEEECLGDGRHGLRIPNAGTDYLVRPLFAVEELWPIPFKRPPVRRNRGNFCGCLGRQLHASETCESVHFVNPDRADLYCASALSQNEK